MACSVAGSVSSDVLFASLHRWFTSQDRIMMPRRSTMLSKSTGGFDMAGVLCVGSDAGDGDCRGCVVMWWVEVEVASW